MKQRISRNCLQHASWFCENPTIIVLGRIHSAKNVKYPLSQKDGFLGVMQYAEGILQNQLLAGYENEMKS